MTVLADWIQRTPPGRTLVIGAGSLGVMVADAVVATGRCGFDAIAMLDDAADLHGSKLHGMPVLGAIDLVVPLAADDKTLAVVNATHIDGTRNTAVVIAIASNAAREAIVTRLPAGLPWLTVVHPGATVSPLATLGEGTVVLPGTAIDPDCTIGRHVVVNKLCSLGHNCTLEDFVQLGPNVASGGNHARGSFTGMGANVLPGVRIGVGSTVGAGAMVHRDVADGATAVGVPAR